jgi:glutathione synthase/RimK-type ligase-like ATP-grasp enzyme
MKIAIHYRKGSFSDRWITYCENKGVSYKLVNCYDSDIITQLSDCDGLMWHWNQNDYKAILFARQLTLALEKKNIKVFPDVNTAWHFDDKVGQKYLLEAINAPLVPSYVFYSKSDALKWIDVVLFPKVFKLRGGAGSVNVSLANTKNQAKKLVNKAFGKGFSSINKWARLRDRIWHFKSAPNLLNFRGIISGIIRLFIPLELEKFSNKEKGYIYFQDFIPNNKFDTRVIVIGNKCFAVRRYCRKDDFRASGSGIKGYEKDLFDEKMIKEAFDISKKLKSQSIAFDFIWQEDCFKIVEISYCFVVGSFYNDCHGYWDSDLVWYAKEVNPQFFMIEDFVNILLEK